MDTERDLLEKACGRNDLVESVLYQDSFDNWNLVADLGKFLIQTFPDMIMGHAFLARASRHLGDVDRARSELEVCRRLDPHPTENAGFLQLVSDEERKLASASPEP